MSRQSMTLPRSLKKMKKETQAFIVAHLTPTKRKLVFDPDFDKILADATQKEITAPVKENKNMGVEVEKAEDDSDDSNKALTFGLQDLRCQLFRQLHRKRPVFNLMVVGMSGLGKSSFVNSLFCADILKPGPMAKMPLTTSIEMKSVILEEKKIQLELSVIDTPGFGVAINNTGCLDPILAYIDMQYEMYRMREFSIDRNAQVSPGYANDTRVHCCIYFIQPTGHALTELDILALTQLSTVANVVAVIARADSLTPDELAHFKQTINRQLNDNRIKLCDFCGDEEAQKKSPFAVVSHNSVIEDENGELKRVRAYPWGYLEVDKIGHCETKLLQKLIISQHFFDLIEETHQFHYQNYRTMAASFPKY